MSMRRLLTAVALLPALLAPAVASADQLTVRGTQVFTSVTPPLAALQGNEFVAFNGSIYFAANDDVHGNELWRTDGTNEGTALVADLRVGPAASGLSNSNPHGLTVVGNRLFFTAYSNATENPNTLFYIDAANPNTAKTLDPLPIGNNKSAAPSGTILGAPNGRLVFVRYQSEINAGYAVYTLPPGGTALTKISVASEDAGVNQVFSPSATAGGWTYYARSNTNQAPGEGAELWRTNGLTTQQVKNIYPDVGDSRPGSNPNGFVATSDRVYFMADDGTHGRELWVTNPADPADTHIVYEHVPGTGGTGIDDPGAIANGNILYYVPFNDPVTGSEVWRTDGTPAGTRVVKDITPGPGGQSQPVPFALGSGLGILRGAGVFGSDGTDAGTSLLASVDGDGYGPNSPVVIGNRGYFVGGASPFGQALWRTDGTAAGTHPLSAGGFDGTPAKSGNVSAQNLIALGSKLIFFGRDPETSDNGRVKLFVIDTTLPDEQRVATTAPAITGKPEVSQVLQVSQGTWSGRPTVFSYQWLRNGQPIDGATNGVYYTGAADLGQSLSVRVTTIGIGAPREASANSNAVTIGGAGTAPGATVQPPGGSSAIKPTPVPTPKLPSLTVKKKAKLTGSARVGATLKVTAPTFTVKGVTLTYRWSAGTKVITGKTKSSLKLAKAQSGKKINVTIVATKSGFAPTEFKVGPSGTVKAAAKRR